MIHPALVHFATNDSGETFLNLMGKGSAMIQTDEFAHC